MIEFWIHLKTTIIALVVSAGALFAQSVDTGPGIPGVNSVPWASMQTVSANTIVGNPTASTGNVASMPMVDCLTAGSALIWTGGTGFGCNTAISAATVNGFTPTAVLSGTTGSIGGGVLVAGACSSGTVNVTNATTAMVAAASPNTYPGDGSMWNAQVTSAGVVTVKVCAVVALTPSASTYNVRVLQ